MDSRLKHGKWTVKEYTIGISKYAKLQMWQLAIHLFQEMLVVRIQRNVISFNAGISALEKGGKWLEALSLFDEIPCARLQHDVFSWSATISACSKGQEWQRAVSLFHGMPAAKIQPNLVSYNAVITSMEKGGHWQVALSLLEAILGAQFEPNIISFSAAMSSCVKNGHWEEALSLFEVMSTSKIQPTVITYTSAIASCEEGQQWQHGLSFLERMSRETLRPNVISFTAAISSCAKCGQWQCAISLFDRMQEGHIQCDTMSCGAAISSCEKEGQWETALNILQSMSNLEIQLDIININAATSCCEKGGQWQRALGLFQGMWAARIYPNVISFNATISAFEKGSRWQQALRLFESMPEKRCEPNIISYSAIISSCEKLGQWQHALSLFECILNNSIELNVISYNAVLSSCEKAEQWQHALVLFEAMPMANIESNVISFSATISACEKAGEWLRALGFLELMMEETVEANVITFNATISACEKAGKWLQALALLEVMMTSMLEPDDVSFNAAISSCEKGQSLELVGWCGLTRGFPAHRLILASASPVFAKMMQSDMKEAHTRTILIEDVSPEVVAKALRFMYTGEVADDVDIESLGFAHKYDITGMMQPVSSKILKNLSPENVSATVRSLRPYKRSISETSDSGLSQLHGRVRQRVLKDLKLMEACLDGLSHQLRELDKLGRNMLHMALMRHRPDIVRAILSLQEQDEVMDVLTSPFEASGESDKDRIPCIHLALSGACHKTKAHQSLECLQLLLDQPVNLVPQVDNSGRSGLHACAFGSVPAVELLLGHNADPGLQDDYGFMPLHYAIDSRNPECVKLMLQVSDRSAFSGELSPFYRCIDRSAWDAALLLHKHGWEMKEADISFLFDFAASRGLSKEWNFVAESFLAPEGVDNSAMEEVIWPEIFKEPNTVLVTHAHCGRHGLIPEETDDPQLRHELISQIPENPHRLEVLCGENGLLRTDLFRDLRWNTEPNMAPIVDVLRVHEFWYVQKLIDSVQKVRQLGRNRPMAIDRGDTKVTPDSWSAALHAAGAVLEAVDQVCNEQARNAFCAVRPPGHHLGPAGAVDKQALKLGG
eukprot:symbB.v1.2.000178.t2/scaffold9.1/size550961/34